MKELRLLLLSWRGDLRRKLGEWLEGFHILTCNYWFICTVETDSLMLPAVD